MCLTGVDYFSTLGYQPGIAFLAAGVLSPLATLVLVLLTLFGALPMYRRVAQLSPHGQGSISILEELLPRWRGKALVLCLLGFAATGFVITMTLSAADATAHVIENPYTPEWMNHPIAMTLLLLAALGAVFLKGFREAIGLAVPIVAVYLVLNTVVLVWGVGYLWERPEAFSQWTSALAVEHGNPLNMVLAAMIVFPRLALGLSGFETGVAVMPLVRGDPDDTESRPVGRIRNTQKLLTAAAVIMSIMLVSSSVVTTLLIPAEQFQEGGQANGRALAYLAHEHLGNVFGTLYDLSTVVILWFAGASAMVGLLNLVPRYLPRYGMAPDWARANRPLVVIFTGITFLVTIVFKADVFDQGGAYATGVLVLMGSSALAVTLAARRARRRWAGYLLLTAIFGYTIGVNVFERPEGIKIASVFIVTIVLTSLVSRVMRSTELRVLAVEPDALATRFLAEAGHTPVRIIANRPDSGLAEEYEHKLREARESHHLPIDEPVLFVEVRPGDVSEFSGHLKVDGVDVDGHRVLRCVSPAIPNAIAALLLHIRDKTTQIPHAYFGWTEGNPIAYLLKFLAFGEGDTAPVTREVLRQTEPDPMRRPRIHVG
ncbi:MAG: amino acid transporter [Acidobacteria bacterium]|nr:amino acid transporter [Acidobacteriota bacterium]MCA1583875.1 amino acid transporter [Acidobacteriota bacterium]MCA1648902.1 amino acid transporter [Acidobacteriota bacterium]